MIHDTLDSLCCKTLSFADECGATLSGLLKIRNQSFIADSRLFPANFLFDKHPSDRRIIVNVNLNLHQSMFHSINETKWIMHISV